MANPFVVIGRGMEDLRPLCPVDNPDHEEWYVAVDHTQQAFDAIVQILVETQSAGGSTRVILAFGDEGTGKTSALNRAIHWLQREAAREKLEHRHIDLSEELAFGLSSQARIQYLVSRLIDNVAFSDLLSNEDLSKLEQKRDQPQSALPYLAQLMKAGGKRLSILVPRLEVQEELFLIVDCIRSPITVFTECTEQGLVDAAQSKYGSSASSQVRVVTLGPLELEDGWRFIEARLQREPHAAKVTESVVTQFMQSRISGRGRTTILELQRTCQLVWDEAAKANVQSIDYVHFADSYVRRGIIPS